MRTLFLLLVFCGVSLADPPKIVDVLIPPATDFAKKLSLRAGDVLIQSGGDDSVWTVTGLSKNYVLWQKSGIVVFNVPAEVAKGTQYILSCSAKGEISQVLVTIGDKPVDPVNPVNPPKPVDPDKPPPPDAMVQKFKDAYTKDASISAALKPKALDKLIALYDLAQSESDNVEYTTVDTLRNAIRDAGGGLMTNFLKENNLASDADSAKKVLTSVRQLIAEETANTLPDDTALDDATRKKAKAMYKRIHDSLVLVK